VRFAGHLSYRSTGTVEFLVDLQHDSFYFLEMNARIQVEHPITEAVTGVDLIAEQIAIAAGAGLRLKQADVRRSGCAMECRVNAEDATGDFRPSPGVVAQARWPSGPGIRVDTHIATGSSVPPFYDSLLAKIIAHAPDRSSTLALLQQAIAATRVTGVATNLSFLAAVLADPQFQAGGIDTGFVARLLERGTPITEPAAHG
jgi:acetyl-CoA carboxylase, biotin carboxylase subunit